MKKFLYRNNTGRDVEFLLYLTENVTLSELQKSDPKTTDINEKFSTDISGLRAKPQLLSFGCSSKG